jgi:hypothetical protein
MPGLLEDHLRQTISGRRTQRQPPPHAVTLKACRYHRLLEMPLNGRVEEWPPESGEFCRRRPSTLHYGYVTRGEQLMEMRYVAQHLDAVRNLHRADIDARACDQHDPNAGHESAQRNRGRAAQLKEVSPD